MQNTRLSPRTRLLLVLAAFVAFMLLACDDGGSGSGNATPTKAPPPPPTMSQQELNLLSDINEQNLQIDMQNAAQATRNAQWQAQQ